MTYFRKVDSRITQHRHDIKMPQPYCELGNAESTPYGKSTAEKYLNICFAKKIEHAERIRNIKHSPDFLKLNNRSHKR